MRVGLDWRRPAQPSPQLIEVVTPRTNSAALSSTENLLAAIALAEPFALEIHADQSRRRFLVRSGSERMRQQLASQLAAAYPQSDLRPLPLDSDPALRRPDEQAAVCTLGLRAAAYLPIRSFSDLDVDGERAAQADPVLGILSALGDLPSGWRGLSQLVLAPAPEDWCREYLRLAVQHPLEHERVPRPTQTATPTLGFMALLLAMAVIGLQSYVWLLAGQWLQLFGLAAASALGLVVGLPLVRRLLRPAVYDMELVREKVTRVAYRAELRLAVFAPASEAASGVRAQLDRVSAAYRRYNLAAANGFVARSLIPAPADLRLPIWLGPHRQAKAILTTRELAGLWHLPHAAADVALLERTTARRWLPLPLSVAEGCRIGVSGHQGRQVPVALPPDVLGRHLLLVAKTRRGKSTLMLRLAHHAMQSPRRAVLLVDPHRDLAEAALGLVPDERGGDVVFLDVADRARPFGLNLLDTGLGWDRDRAVANALSVFQREWGERYWGPRMEDAFRFALLSLFDANTALCAADPHTGRAQQHTLLEVPTILSDIGFRRQTLQAVTDPSVLAWWSDYFEPLDRRFQLELINPVLSKIHRFEGSTAARHIVGQPASTIDPAIWLRKGGIVIVNTARGIVGDNAAALIGSTLLNLVTLAVAEQARLEPGGRWPISMFVDEFHTIPGADYEAILAELNKYGANLVLATQSLARLLALGRDDGRGLRATVFANLDGLFAFNCSAEDATYLVPELGGAIDEQDLVELGEHQCYVRLSSGGQRLPTFSVNLDPPLAGNADLGATLARSSAERYGRDVGLVEADRRSAVARVLQARAARIGAVTDRPVNEPNQPNRRNQHRQRKQPTGGQLDYLAPNSLNGAKPGAG
jgi:Helicase HerA, central domain